MLDYKSGIGWDKEEVGSEEKEITEVKEDRAKGKKDEEIWKK